jgi:hypothetical protein
MPIIGIIKPIDVPKTLAYNSIYICVVDIQLAEDIKNIIKEFKDV